MFIWIVKGKLCKFNDDLYNGFFLLKYFGEFLIFFVCDIVIGELLIFFIIFIFMSLSLVYCVLGEDLVMLLVYGKLKSVGNYFVCVKRFV